MSSTLPFTGERFVPGAPQAKGEMWYEHWHRYHYLLPLVAGKKVLDVACGTGYGAALLSRAAQEVDGVDIAAEAINSANTNYAQVRNLTFAQAPCESLPFEAGAFDVVVSFETIEHIHAQAEFLDEIRRVLKPDGWLALSSPNKAEYTDKRAFSNEFHVKELYRAELEALLAPRFAHRRWLSQRNVFASLIAPEQPDGDARGTAGESLVASQASPDVPAAALPALYYLVMAGNAEATLNQLPARFSLFTDSEEWAFNDYRDTYRGFQHYLQQSQELEVANAALRRELDALRAAPSPAPAAPPAATDESWLARFIKRLST